ncbi:MAG TPA: four helix bundle protein [Candidatus Saccharimonadales bacterium]|nr:four helix bundle protein [Candidatus Saccharimonadales bacterium]
MTSEELYDRLLSFAKRCQRLVKSLPKTTYNYEYSSQLIRSSASPGANYIEAIEASSRKDFAHRLKICRKESKESIHWLMLISSANEELQEVQSETKILITEAQEFIRIFTSSILTSERNGKINK